MTNQVLVVGCAATHVPSFWQDMSEELNASLFWHVEQRWGFTNQPRKFDTFNTQLLRRYYKEFSYIVFCDDDVILPPGFLDAYLTFVRRLDFAVAQPARSLESTFSHPITMQRPGIARRTQFIEAGPVFSIRQDVFDLFLPYDVSFSGMCAGREFVWSHQLKTAGLRQGIIDATPVSHTLRKDGVSYDRAKTREQMDAYLSYHTDRLLPAEAMVVLEQWP